MSDESSQIPPEEKNFQAHTANDLPPGQEYFDPGTRHQVEVGYLKGDTPAGVEKKTIDVRELRDDGPALHRAAERDIDRKIKGEEANTKWERRAAYRDVPDIVRKTTRDLGVPETSGWGNYDRSRFAVPDQEASDAHRPKINIENEGEVEQVATAQSPTASARIIEEPEQEVHDFDSIPFNNGNNVRTRPEPGPASAQKPQSVSVPLVEDQPVLAPKAEEHEGEQPYTGPMEFGGSNGTAHQEGTIGAMLSDADRKRLERAGRGSSVDEVETHHSNLSGGGEVHPPSVTGQPAVPQQGVPGAHHQNDFSRPTTGTAAAINMPEEQVFARKVISTHPAHVRAIPTVISPEQITARVTAEHQGLITRGLVDPDTGRVRPGVNKAQYEAALDEIHAELDNPNNPSLTPRAEETTGSQRNNSATSTPEPSSITPPVDTKEESPMEIATRVWKERHGGREPTREERSVIEELARSIQAGRDALNQPLTPNPDAGAVPPTTEAAVSWSDRLAQAGESIKDPNTKQRFADAARNLQIKMQESAAATSPDTFNQTVQDMLAQDHSISYSAAIDKILSADRLRQYLQTNPLALSNLPERARVQILENLNNRWDEITTRLTFARAQNPDVDVTAFLRDELSPRPAATNSSPDIPGSAAVNEPENHRGAIQRLWDRFRGTDTWDTAKTIGAGVRDYGPPAATHVASETVKLGRGIGEAVKVGAPVVATVGAVKTAEGVSSTLDYATEKYGQFKDSRLVAKLGEMKDNFRPQDWQLMQKLTDRAKSIGAATLSNERVMSVAGGALGFSATMLGGYLGARGEAVASAVSSLQGMSEIGLLGLAARFQKSPGAGRAAVATGSFFKGAATGAALGMTANVLRSEANFISGVGHGVEHAVASGEVASGVQHLGQQAENVIHDIEARVNQLEQPSDNGPTRPHNGEAQLPANTSPTQPIEAPPPPANFENTNHIFTVPEGGNAWTEVQNYLHGEGHNLVGTDWQGPVSDKEQVLDQMIIQDERANGHDLGPNTQAGEVFSINDLTPAQRAQLDEVAATGSYEEYQALLRRFGLA